MPNSIPSFFTVIFYLPRISDMQRLHFQLYMCSWGPSPPVAYSSRVQRNSMKPRHLRYGLGIRYVVTNSIPQIIRARGVWLPKNVTMPNWPLKWGCCYWCEDIKAPESCLGQARIFCFFQKLESREPNPWRQKFPARNHYYFYFYFNLS